jgi:predicted transcriptional regulator
MTDVLDIHFELSNEDRISIMKALLEKRDKLTRLSQRLNLKNQEVSRHLLRLETSGLVEKATDGTYNTTPFGEFCLFKDSELAFLVQHKDYFNTHRINDLPVDLKSKIGVLSHSRFIDDTLVSFQIVKKIIEDSEDYLYRLSSQFMMMLLDPIVEAAERGVDYNFIYSADIQLPPDSDQTVKLRDASDKGNFHSYTHRDVKGFMVMSEKEILIAFPQLDGKYDYIGFYSEDESVLRWGKDLYMHHYSGRQPPLPLWDDIPRK